MSRMSTHWKNQKSSIGNLTDQTLEAYAKEWDMRALSEDCVQSTNNAMKRYMHEPPMLYCVICEYLQTK